MVGYDDVLVLGDLVGDGAEPNGVADCVRALEPLAIIRGNHDKVCSGLESAESFNFVARQSAHWTWDHLRPANRAYLAALPPGPRAVTEQVEICHGTPTDEDAYVLGELDVLFALRSTNHQLCLFGHTHVPIAFGKRGARRRFAGLEATTMKSACRCTSTRSISSTPGRWGSPGMGTHEPPMPSSMTPMALCCSVASRIRWSGLGENHRGRPARGTCASTGHRPVVTTCVRPGSGAAQAV